MPRVYIVRNKQRIQKRIFSTEKQNFMILTFWWSGASVVYLAVLRTICRLSAFPTVIRILCWRRKIHAETPKGRLKRIPVWNSTKGQPGNCIGRSLLLRAGFRVAARSLNLTRCGLFKNSIIQDLNRKIKLAYVNLKTRIVPSSGTFHLDSIKR